MQSLHKFLVNSIQILCLFQLIYIWRFWNFYRIIRRWNIKLLPFKLFVNNSLLGFFKNWGSKFTHSRKSWIFILEFFNVRVSRDLNFVQNYILYIFERNSLHILIWTLFLVLFLSCWFLARSCFVFLFIWWEDFRNQRLSLYVLSVTLLFVVSSVSSCDLW